MSVQFSMNIEEAKSIIKSLPSAEYDITLTGNANSEDLHSLYLGDKSRKINLTMCCDIRFLSECVFSERDSLASVLLPSNSSLEVIGNSSFAFCKNLSKIELPPKLKVIGNEAFWGCFSLSEINFFGSVLQWNNIVKGKNWSRGIPALCVKCSDGEVPIDMMYFHDSGYDEGKTLIDVHPKAKSIELPATCDKVHEKAFEKSSVSEIKVSENSKKFFSYDGVLYTKSDKKLCICPPKKSGVLTIPKGYSMDFYEGISFVSSSYHFAPDSISEIHFQDSRKTVGFPSGFDAITQGKSREIPVTFG